MLHKIFEAPQNSSIHHHLKMFYILLHIFSIKQDITTFTSSNSTTLKYFQPEFSRLLGLYPNDKLILT